LTAKLKRKSTSLRIAAVAVIVMLVFGAIIATISYYLSYLQAPYFGIAIFAAIAAVSIIFGILLKVTINRTLEYTLQRILKADYHFNNEITNFAARSDDSTAGDQITRVYGHFAEVMSSFQTLLNDTNAIINQHLEGDYKARLNETNYSGLHKKIASQTNTLLDYYINDYLELFKVLKEYADGDFSTAIRSYEGEWLWANKIMDDLRNNLINVTDEIGNLTQNAINGNFDTFIDTTDQKGQWLHILNELDTWVTVTKEPLHKICENLTETSKGNLQLLDGDFKGEFDIVKNAVNLSNSTNLKIIDEISDILTGIAQGDLGKKPVLDYLGAYEPINKALHKILNNLNSSLREISRTANDLLNWSNNLSHVSDKLASSANLQSGVVQELHSTMESINQAVQESLHNLDFLSKQAENSKQYGNDSLVGINNMVHAMDDIQDSSVRISKALRAIDDIAFQTNLLSLNASVEAARAGESGRGFAVVAIEVGSLSNRSQAAARETEELISESLTRVSTGTESVKNTANALEFMVKDVDKAGELIFNIADTFNNTASTIASVNREISNINNIVQANATTSKECYDVANEFNTRAQRLMDMVSFYKFH